MLLALSVGLNGRVLGLVTHDFEYFLLLAVKLWRLGTAIDSGLTNVLNLVQSNHNIFLLLSFLHKSLGQEEFVLWSQLLKILDYLLLSLAQLTVSWSDLIRSVFLLDVKELLLDLIPNLMGIVFLVLVGSVNLGKVISHWSYSVLEVHQISSEVLDIRHIWIKLSLWNQRVSLEVVLWEGEVLENLHESYSLFGWKVVQVFKEFDFFWVRFEVISVLLGRLIEHVLSVWGSLVSGTILILLDIKGKLSQTVLLLVLGVDVDEIGLKLWVSLKSSGKESFLHSVLSSLINCRVVSELSIFVFEDFLGDNVIHRLVNVVLKPVVNEVKESWVEGSRVDHVLLINELVDLLVFWIVFKVSGKVVSVLSLFLSEISEEVSIVLNLSLSHASKSSLLSSFVVISVSEFSGREFLNLVPDSIELGNRSFNIYPGLVSASSNLDWVLVVSQVQVLLNSLISHLHTYETISSLLEVLKSVSWVNEKSVLNVFVNHDVYTVGWVTLNGVRHSIVEIVEE